MEKGMKFAHRLADGPTVAHGADQADHPRLPRGRGGGGRRASPADQFADLFASEDLQNAVASFLKDGPGKATFEGK